MEAQSSRGDARGCGLHGGLPRAARQTASGTTVRESRLRLYAEPPQPAEPIDPPPGSAQEVPDEEGEEGQEEGRQAAAPAPPAEDRSPARGARLGGGRGGQRVPDRGGAVVRGGADLRQE